MRRLLTVTTAVLTLGAPAAATASAPAAAPSAAAPVIAAGPLSATAGVLAFSTWDVAAQRYHLAIRTTTGVTVPPVAPQPEPVRLTAGQDGAGRPIVAWWDCSATRCALHIYDVTSGRDTAVPGVPNPAQRPAVVGLDHGRIAWLTRNGAGTRAPQLAIAPLTDLGAAQRFVPALPKICAGMERRRQACTQPATGAQVRALALSGTRLAMLFDGPCDCESASHDVTLSDTRGGVARLITENYGWGMTDADYAAPLFDQGALWVADSCIASEGNGCTHYRNVLRVPLAGGATTKTPFAGLYAYARAAGVAFGIPQSHCKGDPLTQDNDAPVAQTGCTIVQLN